MEKNTVSGIIVHCQFDADKAKAMVIKRVFQV